jgi:cell volume regulation protein A
VRREVWSAVLLCCPEETTVRVPLRLPVPLLLLVAAAVLPIPAPSLRVVDDLVKVALVVILFNGGMGIGRRRLRDAWWGVLSLGLVGTIGTVAGAALVVHVVTGVSWYLSLLLATAVAPTDPAVVFSVLGGEDLGGPSGTVLEGESGANDPVGIAMLAALLAGGSLTGGALADAAGSMSLQLLVGLLVGVAGGWLLARPSEVREGWYAVAALLAAGALFEIADLAHGSGFLAVFVAGIVLGDEHHQANPLRRVHARLGAAGEVVAFALLGLTIDVGTLARSDVWLPGLGIAVLLAAVVRPVVGLPLLLPARLTRAERGFVLFAGLKGAVPLLLGTALLPLADGERLYGMVVVVVLVSVAVQGSLVPAVTRRLGLSG